MSYGLILINYLKEPQVYIILIGLLLGVLIYLYTGALLFSFIVLMILLAIGVFTNQFPSWLLIIIILYFVSLIMERYA